MKTTIFLSGQEALKIIKGEITKDDIVREVQEQYIRDGLNPPSKFEFGIRIDLYDELVASIHGQDTGVTLCWPMEDWGGQIIDKEARFALEAMTTVLGDPEETE